MNRSILTLLMALPLAAVLGGLAACGAGSDLGGSTGLNSPATPATPFAPAPPPAAWADDGCILCHGPDGAGGAGGPDIRCSDMALLDTYLRDGATAHAGGAFPDLTDAELADMVAFLRTADCPGTSPTGTVPPSHTESEDGVLHHPDYETNLGTCATCHGANLEGSDFAPSCTSCHGLDDDDDFDGDDSDDSDEEEEEEEDEED